ncbi:MAG: FAD:protein FMN transferase [Clostridia bacterium]|nr:FAD:protein FMN transferase [Clostridia bacterium]
MKRLLSVIILVSIFALSSCEEDRVDPYYAYGTAMDTNVSICIYGGNKNAANSCLELLYDLEGQFSVTAKGSKLSALNRGELVEDKGHFYTLCGLANEICTLTEGAYNPCVYPLVKLWGFTTGNYNVPSEDKIAESIKLVNESKIVFKQEGICIEGDGAADFGGIAKGYASDVLREHLKSQGVDGAVISLGGNIATVGSKPDGKKWSIGINSPKGNGGLLGTLLLGECAVVTSGSYFRNFVENGKFYHHIIDPQSGEPADSGLVSVTVIAKDAALADGLSTAFFVMGMENAKIVAESLDVETVFVTENEIYVSSGLKEKFTPDSSVEGEYQIIYN